jgi:hypothetical protein
MKVILSGWASHRVSEQEEVLMARRLVFLFLGVIVISLMITSVALAATPQQIYDDFAVNGPFSEGKYTDPELRAYLNDALLAQYSDPTIKGRLDDLVDDFLTRDTFPFTGFQLMIAGLVAVALVGGGIALRRLSRPQKS